MEWKRFTCQSLKRVPGRDQADWKQANVTERHNAFSCLHVHSHIQKFVHKHESEIYC